MQEVDQDTVISIIHEFQLSICQSQNTASISKIIKLQLEVHWKVVSAVRYQLDPLEEEACGRVAHYP